MATRRAAPKAQKNKNQKKALRTVFKYFAPEAKKVYLAGSFNEWRDEDIFLKKDKNGYWSTSLDLADGRYEYRYVVDGQWVNDQNQIESVPNPFGSWNSVIQVQN